MAAQSFILHLITENPLILDLVMQQMIIDCFI